MEKSSTITQRSCLFFEFSHASWYSLIHYFFIKLLCHMSNSVYELFIWNIFQSCLKKLQFDEKEDMYGIFNTLFNIFKYTLITDSQYNANTLILILYEHISNVQNKTFAHKRYINVHNCYGYFKWTLFKC